MVSRSNGRIPTFFLVGSSASLEKNLKSVNVQRIQSGVGVLHSVVTWTGSNSHFLE